MKRFKVNLSIISIFTSIFYLIFFISNSFATNINVIKSNSTYFNSTNATSQTAIKWFKDDGTNYIICFKKECISLAKQYIDPDYILNAKTTTFTQTSRPYSYEYNGSVHNNIYIDNRSLYSNRLKTNIFTSSFKAYVTETYYMGGGGKIDLWSNFTLNKVHSGNFYCDFASTYMNYTSTFTDSYGTYNINYSGEGYGSSTWWTSTDSIWATEGHTEDCDVNPYNTSKNAFHALIAIDDANHLGNKQIGSGTWSVNNNTLSKMTNFFTGYYKRGTSSAGEETIIVPKTYVKNGSRAVAILSDKSSCDLKKEVVNHTCDFNCTSQTNTEHTLVCPLCGKIIQGAHNFIDYDGIKNDKCKICNYAKEINVTINYNDDICDTEYIRACNSSIINSRTANKTGYDFMYWDEIDYGDNPPYTISTISNATIIKKAGNTSKKYIANYIPHTYTFLLKENDNYNITFATSSVIRVDFVYDIEKQLPKNTFIKKGYNFLGWSLAQGTKVIFKDEDIVLNYTATNSEIISFYPEYEKKYINLKIIDGNSISIQKIDIDQLKFNRTSSSSYFKEWQITGYKNLKIISSPYNFTLEDLNNYDKHTFTITAIYDIPPSNSEESNTSSSSSSSSGNSGNSGGGGNKESNLSGKESNVINTVTGEIIEGKQNNALDSDLSKYINALTNKQIENENVNKLKENISTKDSNKTGNKDTNLSTNNKSKNDKNKNSKIIKNNNSGNGKDPQNNIRGLNNKNATISSKKQIEYMLLAMNMRKEFMKNFNLEQFIILLQNSLNKVDTYIDTNQSGIFKFIRPINALINKLSKEIANLIFAYPKIFKTFSVVTLYFSLLTLIILIGLMLKKLIHHKNE